MHAASVNPEPGSNSLKNYISSPSGLKTFFRAIICSFYFCLSSILKKLRDSSFTHLHMLCTSSLVVQFSMTNVPFPSFSGQLVYYITIFSICQALFSIFLKFFQNIFSHKKRRCSAAVFEVCRDNPSLPVPPIKSFRGAGVLFQKHPAFPFTAKISLSPEGIFPRKARTRCIFRSRSTQRSPLRQ